MQSQFISASSHPLGGETPSEDAVDVRVENEVSGLPAVDSMRTNGGKFAPPDERRGATRFPREEGMDFAVIGRDCDEKILVEVRDESLTGLGIVADTDLGLQVGSYVHVDYAGENLQGEIMHLTMQADGKYHFGLRCERQAPPAAE
jgi:hypothetical protein